LFETTESVAVKRDRDRTRSFLSFTLFFIVLWFLVGYFSPALAQSATQISTARVWPSPDYTRVTLEAAAPVSFTMVSVKDPERLVLDLQGVDITAVLTTLNEKIAADDPYIKSVRVGRFKPGVTRIVLDLKAEVRPQAFVLPPIAEYGHRLVVDLYPAIPNDPLIAFLDKLESQRATPGADAPALHHRGGGRRARRRGPGRERPRRHARERRDAGNRAEAQGAHRPGTQHARFPHARR
jgi:hypothetical protein